MIEHGMPPTRAEIATALGFKSANAAEEHLRALQRKGVLDLRQAGLLKVKSGLTSLEEIEAVTNI